MMRYDTLYESLKEQARNMAHGITPEAAPDTIPSGARITATALELLRHAVVIRLGRDHVRAVTQNPGPQPPNWNVIHPILPCVHVELEGGFIINNMNIENMTILVI